ncbi:type i restriction-modification system methyltransferase subunit : Type I restriction-modification system methyltransferase subunit OS=Marinobacter sp. EVN1 GN=Q672_14970 PE=4 SV=1: Methyltransf_26 [Gemmataceae bacterium]|nr:type i restriction-modification system methyltransferase subunit : Type I restriction-modification system methyltransferase subunit OS=Marinobacter sp. EVN1 GN=Q672_14970 PE=4 SV=1: Methyltransf_26 [Gemmataceae bacterium]VTU00982.1 type i restriction-modification system methyltransferase subunit : Type I restriction-modification system methyltransferase subunit OS=Marinobacter sp. EVN1 GN=Q672_14970 PE=4 SV=1: Methyltransf_26 [Gemmataceae bacterium]
MPTPAASRLRTELVGYGIAQSSVRLFSDAPGPEHQDYLDLIAARDSSPDSPDGVAEAQGRPILYFVDETRLTTSPESSDKLLDGLRGRLACRGERAYLARVQTGRIHVAPVAFEDVAVSWTVYTPASVEGRTLFSRLVNGVVDWDEDIARGDGVFNRLRSLLLHSAGRLAETEELRPDVLSLLGRALFFRFLRDREIVTERDIPTIAPKASTWKDCFDGAVNSAATCRWLDDTFNGNFLPLSGRGEGYFRRIESLTRGDVFNHLTAVVLGAEPKGGSYQLRFDWGTFDFAHVPVGLLSQVYEDFCWHWDRDEAASTSVHYTPRNIAVTLLDEAFHGIDGAPQARVLDPACGAGVFLVIAFRRLYREVWRERGRRPDRRTIRKLLNRQLSGFDVSENALRLAALSLYLTALEMDPSPQPLSELKFQDLRGKVLFHVRPPESAQDRGPVLGSLGPDIGKEHDGQYEIVLSNPPWTSVPTELGTQMEAVARGVLSRAGIEGANSYKNPDNNPDIPFLLRATEWCKKGGRIAMALPARLLLKNKRIPSEARDTVFDLMDVTGVISGVNLAKTSVWRGTDQPFILFFARNRPPAKNPRTQLICPHYDSELNNRGEFRIDADASRVVCPADAKKEPWLWKGWLVGTLLDVEVIRKLIGNPNVARVSDFWKEQNLVEGQGYIISEKNETQRDAKELQGLPDLHAGATADFVVEVADLPRFNRSKLLWPRERKIYRSPLCLLKQSPGTDRTKGFGFLAFDDLAYVSSYYGYSTHGHPEAELLARYLHLVVHSSIWLHFGLITGAQFGAERNKLQKQSIEDFPMVRLDKLTKPQKKQAIDLSNGLVSGSDVFAEIDQFFATIYGLTDADLDVVQDTLDVGQAYRESSGARACAPPTLAECTRFVERLRQLLAPLLDQEPDDLAATLWFPEGRPKAGQTFGAILLGRPADEMDEMTYFQQVLPLADNTGASQVLMKLAGGGLLVGIRNQYRYWTRTRARLLAAEVARRHLDTFTG